VNALEAQVRALEQEIEQLKSIIAYLYGIIQRTQRYAKQVYAGASAMMEKGGMEPRDYNFARGAVAVSGKVVELLSG
jgi:hypothetical protein